MSDNKNIRNVLQLGFGTILLLVFAFALLGMYQIRLVNQNLTRIVEINNTKVELAHNMRDAIRLRQISLISMLAMQDPFARNEELIRFYEYAGLYRQARTALLSLPMDEQEQQIHKQITFTARTSQPLNNKAAELIIFGDQTDAIHSAVEQAQFEQAKLLTLLDGLVTLQKFYAQDAVMVGRKKYDQTLLVVFALGVPLFLGALFIVRLVSRYIAGKNQEIALASEEALSATKAKSAFLATMSHEIRTPMTAIIGFCEVALDDDQNLQQRNKAIHNILSSGKHLLQLLNSVLDLSKIEASRLQLEKVRFSIFEILSDLESFIKPQASEKGLTFTLEYQFPLPIEINSDPLRLKQILLNLCSNALKFTESGTITINLVYSEENNQLAFNIIDTGIGIERHQISKIFDAFTQADSSTTRKYGGSGLGLSLSQQLAKALEGEILVTSYAGIGSQFTLALSLKHQTDLTFANTLAEIPKPLVVEDSLDIPAGLKGEVLLAEDNELNQQLIGYLLNKMGANVTIVNNGKAAVSMAFDKHFDIIFMDMQMPIMNGLNATQLLRSRNYTKPIVALSANVSAKDKALCLSTGCNDFVTKPIDRTRLFKVTAQFLEKSSDAPARNRTGTSLTNKQLLITELITKFATQLPNEISKIKVCYVNAQWWRIKEIAHQLKGTGGALSFPIVTEIAGAIEHEITNANYTGVYKLIEQLDMISKDILLNHKTKTLTNTNANIITFPTIHKN